MVSPKGIFLKSESTSKLPITSLNLALLFQLKMLVIVLRTEEGIYWVILDDFKVEFALMVGNHPLVYHQTREKYARIIRTEYNVRPQDMISAVELRNRPQLIPIRGKIQDY